MEKFTPDYSLKNIPYPTLQSYTLDLTEKIIDVIKRIRWKTHFFLHPPEEHHKKETFNLKTQNTPPTNPLLDPFEEDLLRLVRKIKFTKQHNKFQQKILNDIRKIKTSDKVWVTADKTKNIYKITPQEYKKLLHDKITDTYKADNSHTETHINRDTGNIAKKLNIIDRMGKLDRKDAYITFKDHKNNFINKKQTRLINPTKSDLGLISKHIIKKIIRKIQEKQRHNLWVNSEDTIEWFKKIKNKTNSTFIQFDIVDFYPSITEDILKKSIHHAKTYTNITDEEIEIITTCRKSILYSNNHAWIKNSQNNFDVPMGAYDSAQIADLVDIYIIDTLGTIIDKEQIGIYKDDGLIHITNSNGPKTSKVQKQIIKKFKEIGFKIEIQANLKITNYLDITLNLNNNTYKPYSKDDQPPTYININSNHPQSIITHLPNAINTRINRLSANEKTFHENCQTYNQALNKSGYTTKLKYIRKQPATNNNERITTNNREYEDQQHQTHKKQQEKKI